MITQYWTCSILSKPVYTHTNIPIHWSSNQSHSIEWTLPLESNEILQCPYNLASSRCIAFYANKYLLTVNEHYKRIPTVIGMRGKWPYSCCFDICCLQNMFNIAGSILVQSLFTFFVSFIHLSSIPIITEIPTLVVNINTRLAFFENVKSYGYRKDMKNIKRSEVDPVQITRTKCR